MAAIVQGAHHLEPGKDSQDAVEAPAGRLGVEMAADGDRIGGGVAARPAREDVADGIDGDATAGGFAFRHEPAPHFGILRGERLAVEPALGRRADGGARHQAGP